MAEWRLFRGWSADELQSRIEGIERADRNFDAEEEDMTGEAGWAHYYSEAVIAKELPGSDRFERAKIGLRHYQFSKPSVVMAHYDPDGPLLSRRILLEIQVLGLHYLCPALVTRVRDEDTVFGFRYDTLEGHIESGMEWFLLTKDEHGDIRFRIEARWRHGDFPNWWSRLGFRLLSGPYQRHWHREAHRRLSLLAHYGSTSRPSRDPAGLTDQGINVNFTYYTKRKWLQ